jgi:hypothetical protein
MKKLFLLSACASLAIACGSSANNTGTNAGANRTNLAATNTNASAKTLSLNENMYTTASNSYLGSLKPSVGKTASESRLWENKEIDKQLRKLMGADYTTMRKFWNTETPIRNSVTF